ncbi:VWA domain-containing protein [Salmonella enterica]|nr:VWA domain-containing protein [Salmonella enterica subsp. enterica serovar Bredeney]EHF2265067.1 VWA domain-containing protein [Salmonella enterica subsp. enterica serovar Bredeney]EHF9894805.1 VWA domain-containing protein [Salmonella enterica subsp. enterica serovar Bredeney]EHM9798879.1 VWA domain-containing protein [Salmonella enterica]EHN1779575.1 VWA domain-containing protein [Salmonella enterica subsp. enterica serovar Bredeney]
MYNLSFFKFSYIQNNRAAVSVMFAIVLPILIASFSIGIDGARFLIKRAKLSDALSQGSLAVALTGNDNSLDTDITRNEQLLKSYIDYYLPSDKIKPGSLKVTLRKKYDPDDTSRVVSLDYIADAAILSNPIFESLEHGLPGFGKDVQISSDGSNGIVRKTIDESSVESDIVFAVDFSGSMLDPSSEPSMNRLQLLQKIITDLSKDVIKSDSNTKIGIVPFDLGIPVSLSGKNPLGGALIGCSVPYKFNSQYDLDFNFWSYKYPGNIYSSSTDAIKDTNRMLYDYYRYDLGLSTEQLVNSGICISSSVEPFYSCERIGFNLATSTNAYKFVRDYNVMSRIGNQTKTSIANDVTINYSASVDKRNLLADVYKTFEIPFGSSYSFQNVFRGMCTSGFNVTPHYNYYNYPTVISSLKQNTQIINLTASQSQLQKFNKMVAHSGAGTDTTAGLLTAAKVIRSGTNPQKIIIVITDGEDSGELVTVSNRFHTQFQVCKKIVDGLEELSTNTKSVKIYYISLSAKDNNEKRLAFWRDNCVGSDGAFTATDYNSLKSVISSILQKGNLHFINK